MLITEALAELKTIGKRMQKKQTFIASYLHRQEGLKDPLEKDGGSAVVLKNELQAIGDLNKRVVEIRTAIQRTNLTTTLTVEGVTKSIAEWLTWRKEVSNGEVAFVDSLRQNLLRARTQAQTRGVAVVNVGNQANAPTDLIINLDEGELAKQAEKLETILGVLDGQLSLKNATIHVDGV